MQLEQWLVHLLDLGVEITTGMKRLVSGDNKAEERSKRREVAKKRRDVRDSR